MRVNTQGLTHAQVFHSVLKSACRVRRACPYYLDDDDEMLDYLSACQCWCDCLNHTDVSTREGVGQI